jgi:hypothetical protein
MWTKEDNKKLRTLIKEGKSVSEIREIIGDNKLRENPKKKYVNTFNRFKLMEIVAKQLKTDYIFQIEKSKFYENEYNFTANFKTLSENEYIIDLILIKEYENQFKNNNILNISFTLAKNRTFDNYKKYEEETKINEHFEIIKRLMFIIPDSLKKIKKNYSNIILLINETENPQKINFYRNVIKDSFSDVIEIEDTSNFTNGLKAYYYIIENL